MTRPPAARVRVVSVICENGHDLRRQGTPALPVRDIPFECTTEQARLEAAAGYCHHCHEASGEYVCLRFATEPVEAPHD